MAYYGISPQTSLRPGARTGLGAVLTGVLLAFNVISLAGGLIFVTVKPDEFGGLWNAYGLLMLYVLIGNPILAARGEQNRGLAYSYLALHTAGMLLVPAMNTGASSAVTNLSSRSPLAIVVMLLLFLLGGLLALNKLRYPEQEIMFRFTDRPGRLKISVRIAVMVVCCLILLAGIYTSYELLTKKSAGILEVMVPEYALFLALMMLGAAALLLKLRRNRAGGWFNRIVSIIGATLVIILFLPLFRVPSMLGSADTEYERAFGTKPAALVHASFMDIPFSIPEYFYGTPSGGYTVKENVLFYEGTEGADKGIKLHYDVYMPAAPSEQLPGNRSVLIRIHGGGWTIGDKGAGNFAEVNKYFAEQGYIVFDVQYGLSSQEKFIDYAEVPENIVGDFTIDDMVRHIGLFTTYMADRAEEYGADLSSVFVSGGSAGGQLANAVALAMAGGEYEELLDPRLTVKGIIPFYPANGLPEYVGIDGTDELTDPALLVKADSPPSLIYQGTHDGIVDPRIAEAFKEAYETAGNSGAALISMPLASHGSDMYFASYYNRPFMYYMERFMYQYR
ncbi:alpha/beta hydrolase [Paenibacillus tarimensis]|uniref:alpha/beta hydrolase n=1 Tax=Paenibacillus tarimensis TaxID=416012 RepID=UPI001F1ED3FF|nr:alpha/beta hydrolase [Paenibacillus tarimensis]MCF2945726.1 alpha/beta hydrolase [Paenibacillus tarimensis]